MMRKIVWISIVFFVWQHWLLIPGSAATAEDVPWGKHIRYIRIESDYPISEASILRILTVHEGDTLTAPAIRSCLQNIATLQKFSQVDVSAKEFDDGIALVFKLNPEWTVRKIKFKGKQTGFLFAYGFGSKLTKKEITRACQIRENETFSEQKLQESISNLKRLYLSYGYGLCDIQPVVIEHVDTKEVTITFHVHKRTPTLIRQITFNGNKAFSVNTLRKHIKHRPGRRFLENNLENDVSKLRDFYLKKGYLKVRIRHPGYVYDAEENVVDLSFTIQEEDQIKLFLQSPKHWWNLSWWIYRLERKPHTILEVLGLSDTDQIDSDLLDQSAEHLNAIYKKHGYAFSDCRLIIDPDNDTVSQYRFELTEHTKVKTNSITFSGHTTFPEETLRNYILSAEGKVYQDIEFMKDCKAIELFYQNQGFPDVIIQGLAPDLDTGKTDVNLLIKITEGQQHLIKSIGFTGNSKFNRDELIQLSSLKETTPYSDERLKSGINKIVSEYKKQGYANVKIDSRVDVESKSKYRNILLTIYEGYEVTFGKIIVRGARKTKRSVIDRNLLDVEGKPFNLETMQAIQKKLTQTGLFSSVRSQTLPFQQNEPTRNVIVNLKERPSLYLEAGPGFNTDSGLNGYLNFYTTNLFGTNRYLGSSIFISEESEKSQVIYREPEFSGYPIQWEIRIFRRLTQEDGYELFRYGGRSNWTYRFNSKARALLEYRLEEDQPRNIEPGTSIPLDYRNSVRIGSLSPALLFDSRTDPRNPDKGSLFSLKVEFARPVYDSEVDFTKTIFEGFHFIPVHKDHVLGLALRCGWGRDLPFQERFKLGGIKTIRGWGYEDIDGTVSPGLVQEGDEITGIGGNTFIVGNLEWRAPLIWGLMGVVFLDTGNVWESSSDISFDELKTSVGLGIRFMTPIGPVGVDYAVNINRDDDDPKTRWSVIIGHTF
jgi:outer membrane protein insertion porin family